MSDTAVREIALPSAVGWKWVSTYDGFDGVYEHEVVWVRGTPTITFATRAPGNSWVASPITDPERLGFDGTLAGARRVVEAFIGGEDKV